MVAARELESGPGNNLEQLTSVEDPNPPPEDNGQWWELTLRSLSPASCLTERKKPVLGWAYGPDSE